MSEVITDKLTGRATAGDVTITSEGGSATMQLQQGLIKQWARYNQTTQTTDDSLNTSSLTDHGVGRSQFVFVNNCSSSNVCAVQAHDRLSNGEAHLVISDYLSSGYRTYVLYDSGYVDAPEASAMSTGDLA